jgi:hypothetical protein
MKSGKIIALGTRVVMLSAVGILTAACGALLTPPQNREISAESLNLTLVQVAPISAEACCIGAGTTDMIIDGNTSTMWGTPWSDNTSDAYHAHGSQHYINLDLGQVYANVTRLEYVPAWTWSGPGGYGGNNNGICREFEVYVTDKPLLPGEKAPAESLAGYGEWFAYENGSNTLQTAANQKFYATFSSVSGRYVQFRFVSAYYNHWSGYPSIAKIAQAAELRVFTSPDPYVIDKAPLADVIVRANALRSAYLPRYGYTNAILDNWLSKGEKYLGGTACTKEMTDYVVVNLNNYIAQASKRMTGGTYDQFIPKILWADDKGNHLQAHGGGVLWDPITLKWWFYGEDRTSSNGGGQPGVHAYSSLDLYNWKDEGVALPVFNNTAYDTYGWKAVDWDGSVAVAGADREVGFLYKVNRWRKALGDWNCDGVINVADVPYTMPANLKSEIIARGVPWWDPSTMPEPPASTTANHEGAYLIDEKTLADNGLWPTAAEAWDEIKDYIPKGNPSLYISDSNESRPYPGALGLTEGRIAAFNSLYADEPVWRRKQLYRFYNYQSTIERPKVIFNAGGGSSGNTPYTDKNGVAYPYVMFIHLEGGTFDSSYGTARVAIAVARQPQGPYKMVWAYRVHFVENTKSSDNGLSKGMSRDQGVMVDSDGTAYQFGSSEENRFMSINKLDANYTGFVGIPYFACGGNQTEMLTEGYQNKLGENFNWLFANQREAPAPFIHYETPGMTSEGDGSAAFPFPRDEAKRYYLVTSTSSGWYPNPQGMYRSAGLGNYVLGANPHDKPAVGSLSASSANNASESGWNVTGTNWQSGNGWIATQNDSGNDGSTSTLLMGTAGDGSHVSKGYDGQTTHVVQLRYPDHPWGITGYLDEGYVAPDPAGYDNPAAYYAALDTLLDTSGHTKPVYGERTELDEPRKNKLVYGKYIYLSDSWDQYKNYDARYIWLPLRALFGTNANNTYGPRGLKVRWMDHWRWQDFVYDLGPFKDSLTPNPDGEDIWNNIANDIAPLSAYYEMLGAIDEYKLNAGKQNPGL